MLLNQSIIDSAITQQHCILATSTYAGHTLEIICKRVVIQTYNSGK